MYRVNDARLTIGDIAERLKQPQHRIDYLLRTREIKSTGRAGGYRLFSTDVLKILAAEIAEIDRRQKE